MVRILIADSDPEICRSLDVLFSKEGYEVVVATKGNEALSLLSEKQFDIVFCDLRLPDMSGFDVLTNAKKLLLSVQVIVITDTPSIETAVEAMKLGAYDYIRKPLLPDKIRVITKRAIETMTLAAEIQHLKHELSQYFGFHNIIGKSQKMMEVFKLIRQTSDSDSNVLITGESGTGKELVARAIHYNSRRANNRFVPVNCGAISKELVEAELFGYVKGAFSGAVRDKKGFLDLASTGTLFLDEIGETTPDFQVKLLRVIQDGEFNKVGDPYPTKVDVRVVAASNRDLHKALAGGLFREDLFYRLNVISIHIPPLRERREDVPFLAQHFLEKYSRKHKGHKVTEITPSAVEILMNYDYPGNVRELENAIAYAVTFTHGNVISAENLPPAIKSKKKALLSGIPLKSLKTAQYEFNRNFVLAALKECDGNVSRTARVLGIRRQSLQQKIRSLGVEISRTKREHGRRYCHTLSGTGARKKPGK
jgi:DNA-binding NtrC family response regulator